jgi:transcription elongation factor
VLVKLSDGSVAVAGATDADGNTEAVPQGGSGPAVMLDVVELHEVERKDWVKVVSGEYQGKVGQVLAVDGTEFVLDDGEVVDSSIVGKLAVPPAGKQHGV